MLVHAYFPWLCTLTHAYTPTLRTLVYAWARGHRGGPLVLSYTSSLQKKNWCWWNFCLRALCAEKALKGLSGQKKMCTLAHAWTGRWRTLTHTYHPTLRTLAHALPWSVRTLLTTGRGGGGRGRLGPQNLWTTNGPTRSNCNVRFLPRWSLWSGGEGEPPPPAAALVFKYSKDAMPSDQLHTIPWHQRLGEALGGGVGELELPGEVKLDDAQEERCREVGSDVTFTCPRLCFRPDPGPELGVASRIRWWSPAARWCP